MDPSRWAVQQQPLESIEIASLKMSVVVIGGGIVGSSIAWHLSQSNTVNTTIVAAKIGGDATPNSFAWVNAGSTDQKFYYDFRWRSMNRWREIEISEPAISNYIHWGGSLNWEIANETERAEYGEKLKAWGYGVVSVNKTELASTYAPEFEDDFLPNWALRYTEEGQMEAHIVAKKLVEAAQANGAGLLETNVTSFLKSNGRVAGVVLASGEEVRADHVVVAAGLGSVNLLAAEDVDLPLTPKEGLLVNTVPVEKELVSTIAYTNDLHLRQTFDGRIRFGSDYSGADPGDKPQEVANKLFTKLQAAIKGGDQLKFDYYTIGERPTPGDGFPILGETGVDGLSIAVMHSGVTNGALVGELISKLVLTGEKDPMLDNFLLSRFSNTTAGNSTSNSTGHTSAPQPPAAEYTGAASLLETSVSFVSVVLLAAFVL